MMSKALQLGVKRNRSAVSLHRRHVPEPDLHQRPNRAAVRKTIRP